MDRSGMRRCVSTGIVAILALAAAGCGSEEAAVEPEGASASGGGGNGSAEQKASNQPEQLELGDATTLKGLNDASLKVRVDRIEDPMPNPPTERPKAGRRFVGVHVKLTNVGKQRYGDAPLNGSILVTDRKKAANPTIMITGDCPSDKGTKLRLAAGKSWQGCLPFQVKRKAKVTGFQFRLNSGYGPETGEWAR